jgi:hypothetical protein
MQLRVQRTSIADRRFADSAPFASFDDACQPELHTSTRREFGRRNGASPKPDACLISCSLTIRGDQNCAHLSREFCAAPASTALCLVPPPEPLEWQGAHPAARREHLDARGISPFWGSSEKFAFRGTLWIWGHRVRARVDRRVESGLRRPCPPPRPRGLVDSSLFSME